MTVAESPKAKRYPMNVITFARRLHEQNGWSANRIRKALQQRGHSPAHSTVLCWIDDEYREERYDRTRRPGRPGPARRQAWRHRFDRMEQLRKLGLSFRSIAAVMTHDFEDVHVTEYQVRAIFNGTVSNRTVRRLLWPKGAQA